MHGLSPDAAVLFSLYSDASVRKTPLELRGSRDRRRKRWVVLGVVRREARAAATRTQWPRLRTVNACAGLHFSDRPFQTRLHNHAMKRRNRRKIETSHPQVESDRGVRDRRSTGEARKHCLSAAGDDCLPASRPNADGSSCVHEQMLSRPFVQQFSAAASSTKFLEWTVLSGWGDTSFCCEGPYSSGRST